MGWQTRMENDRSTVEKWMKHRTWRLIGNHLIPRI